MLNALRSLTVDGRLLFATRFVRLFAYGARSVVLMLYLVSLGLSESDTGVLLTATLLGDTLVSLYLTTRADRFGRRRMLIIGASLMAARHGARRDEHGPAPVRRRDAARPHHRRTGALLSPGRDALDSEQSRQLGHLPDRDPGRHGEGQGEPEDSV